MKKNIFLSILFFAAGFLTHAQFFPDLWANGLPGFNQQTQTPTINRSTAPPAQQQAFETRIDYDGTQFSRHNISIEIGSYLIITNVNKGNKLMSLSSNNPLLTTPRGYGESEIVKARMDVRGQFVVIDKNNPEEKLIITVK
jgi:hypothetical protein